MRNPRLFSRLSLITMLCFGGLLATATGAILLQANSGGAAMVQSANAFLSTLDDAAKSKALLAYDAAERTKWHFIPMPTRKGLVIRDMNPAQKAAALRLLRAALSESGYEKSRRIMSLEAVLLELEGPKSKGRRDPEKYYVTLFGEPNDTQPWGFSFEGHHMSLNFVVEGGKIVDSTPQFFASNPAEIKNDVSGPLKKGTRVLRDEEQLAFDLMASLQSSQREKAIFAAEAPAEISDAGEPQPTAPKLVGISYASLNGQQQEMLRSLVDVYIDSMTAEVAVDRRQIIDNDGWNDVHFAWGGALKTGIGHYYRVQGKSFLIEFVNTQPDAAGNPANHIHCVWRDLTGDFNLPAK
ncbi:DUF3500 domain-containing protein [Rosistilla oblonga]|uniref:DUF3500 domain-containing protein n=1 Tax=Rosistilla oblonga TaxID=2527990 RepID=UPI003A982738